MQLHRTVRASGVALMMVGSSMAPVAGEVEPAPGGTTSYSFGPDRTLSIDHPLSNAALQHLFEIWPRMVPFPELVEAALRRLGPTADGVLARLDEETEVG